MECMQMEKKIMDSQGIKTLAQIRTAPYIALATILTGKTRRSGGNMYRHQCSTTAILIEYGYLDPVLIKASLVHDVVEDISDFDRSLILNADADGQAVLDLVLEVSRRDGETKAEFLERIIAEGSYSAKVLKVADRISNLVDLGFVTDRNFIERTCDDAENYVLPMAFQIGNYQMFREIHSLILSRRRFLEPSDGVK